MYWFTQFCVISRQIFHSTADLWFRSQDDANPHQACYYPTAIPLSILRYIAVIIELLRFGSTWLILRTLAWISVLLCSSDFANPKLMFRKIFQINSRYSKKKLCRKSKPSTLSWYPSVVFIPTFGMPSWDWMYHIFPVTEPSFLLASALYLKRTDSPARTTRMLHSPTNVSKARVVAPLFRSW